MRVMWLLGLRRLVCFLCSEELALSFLSSCIPPFMCLSENVISGRRKIRPQEKRAKGQSSSLRLFIMFR